MASVRPERRPLASRRRAPRVGRILARGRTIWDRGWERFAGGLWERLYPLAPGRWLRRRLADALEIHTIDVRLDRCGPELDGLRVAFASDLHAGHFMTESDLCRVFERIARAEPDLLVLGGDLIECRPEQALLLGKALSLVEPPLGKFSVPGNHDRGVERSLEIWTAVQQEHGVEILVNRGLRLRRGSESLWLAGVDDLTYGRPDLEAALDGVRSDEPILLLAHHPDFFHEAASVGVDLTLSGHTHGGQIAPFGWTPWHHSRLGYWRGHFEDAGAQLYVGRGIGTTGVPLRIQASPELPILRLRTRSRSPDPVPHGTPAAH